MYRTCRYDIAHVLKETHSIDASLSTIFIDTAAYGTVQTKVEIELGIEEASQS